MAKTSLVQARIDTALKEKAENYFHAFGMDTATAIRIYFAKVAELGRIPFTIGLETEDLEDARIAERAYQDYVASGYIKHPASKLYEKYGI